MNEYDLKIDGSIKINFAPVGDQEIVQNVSMIFASVVHSCPMDRGFAWDGSLLDRPINVVKSLFATRLIAAVNKHEPRAEITGITFAGSDGKLHPTAKVRIKNG